MIDCVAGTPQIALGAVALLEDEDDDPVGREQRDQVQDHRLQRQHDRAERAREQDERQQDDEAEHVGEVRVDGGDEVAVLARDAAERARRCP